MQVKEERGKLDKVEAKREKNILQKKRKRKKKGLAKDQGPIEGLRSCLPLLQGPRMHPLGPPPVFNIALSS